MPSVFVETLSTNFTKALQSGNSRATAFASFDPQTAILSVPDGMVREGHEGIGSQARLQLLPYCEGPPGSQFSMRLYGLKAIMHPEGDPAKTVWFSYFLCELLCTAANQSGFVGRYFAEDEYLCDTISLTQGNLGTTGFINSTGPGTNLNAYALVELLGARYFQFDFAATDSSSGIGMNAFWSRL